MFHPLGRADSSAFTRTRVVHQLANSLPLFPCGGSLIGVMLAVIVNACAGTRLTQQAPEQSYAPVPAESVMVFLSVDVVPEPYVHVVAVDMPQGLSGGWVGAAQREAGAAGSNGIILEGAGGPDVGSAVAGGALDVTSSVAAGVPLAPVFSPLFARPRVRLTGIRSALERRRVTRPVAVWGGHQFRSISAGLMHTCGVTQDDAALCWGWNWVGQLGDGSRTAHFEPGQGGGYLDFASVSAGFAHTCGVLKDGIAYCWGANGVGQLGRGYKAAYNEVAMPVSDELVFTAVTSGMAHTCGLTPDGTVYCWGDNTRGQLGTGDTTSTSRPTAIAGDLRFAQVAAGFGHTCGLTTAGAAYCWGWNSEGQLGDGTTWDRSAPVEVSRELTFASLTGGRLHTCGLTSAGAAYCWGFGATGALGNGTTKSRHKKPESVAGELTFRSLSAGAYFTCGLTTDGQAYCWGLNQHGQLGNDSTTEWCNLARDLDFLCSTTPAPVLADSSFERLGAGVAHACGIAIGGSAYCWGAGTGGQLGDRTTATARALAVQAFSEQKLGELERLPTGLTVEHTPNPVRARPGGPSGRRYIWVFGTTVTPIGSDTVTITEFGSFAWVGDRWSFSNFTGKPFTAQDFAEWYGCPDAQILPGHECTDSENWVGGDALGAFRTRWYYIGVTGDGQRVKGEAIIEELAVVDTTNVP